MSGCWKKASGRLHWHAKRYKRKINVFAAFFIMETSFLLAGKITELTLIVLMGAALVKAGLLKSENSYTLSVIALYLISPSVMIHAFQMDNTPQIIEGLKLSVMLAVFSMWY